jgi:hypothetical protein
MTMGSKCGWSIRIQIQILTPMIRSRPCGFNDRITLLKICMLPSVNRSDQVRYGVLRRFVLENGSDRGVDRRKTIEDFILDHEWGKGDGNSGEMTLSSDNSLEEVIGGFRNIMGEVV